MKTLRHIVILIILISSCKNSNYKKELNCDYIEISYDNGWTGGTAIKINKDLTYKKCYYHIISDVDSCSCFVDNLAAGEYLDRINKMIDSLKNSKIDSIYDANCQDCGAYIIRIKYPDKMIKTMIIGTHRFDTRISSLLGL